MYKKKNKKNKNKKNKNNKGVVKMNRIYEWMKFYTRFEDEMSSFSPPLLECILNG